MVATGLDDVEAKTVLKNVDGFSAPPLMDRFGWPAGAGLVTALWEGADDD